MNSFLSLGLMSGSSLDGLDICLSRIDVIGDTYSYEILKATTIDYPDEIYERLKICRTLSAKDLGDLDKDLGDFFGSACVHFLSPEDLSNLNFICSHGHTVFHYPEKGSTLQIGSAQEIANISGIKTLSNLRAADIASGGSGAPIVPIGDLLFFSDYKYCLNLGGIMNISNKLPKRIISYDVGVCNQIINHYASKLGHSLDRDGQIARSGVYNETLFHRLNDHVFFKTPFPKSLDNGFSQELIDIIDNTNIPIQDKLHSFYHHVAFQVLKASDNINPILTTGGGSHNLFLIQLMREKYLLKIIIPSPDIVNYKESLVMSLIGVRYISKKYNVLASVTGADKNTICGNMFFPSR